MKPLRLLFETQQAAYEVAFMLACEYDGCNMVTVPDTYDAIALKTAIELAGADFCFDGDHHPIVLPLSEPEINSTPGQQAGRITAKAQLWHSPDDSVLMQQQP
jgi:hypothetical protein